VTSTWSWSPLVGSLVLVLCSVGLGIYADEGQNVDGPLGWLPELGTPWVLIAFVGGRLWSRHLVAAALAGPALISLGLWSYWLYMEVAHGTPIYNMTNDGRGIYWLGLGCALGLAAALSGAFSRRGRLRSVAWALVIAVPLAEGTVALNTMFGPPLAIPFGLFAVAVALFCRSLSEASWQLTLVAAALWTVCGVAAAGLLMGVL
jgi:hypothetical protein